MDAVGVSDVCPVDLVGSDFHVVVEVSANQRVQFAGTCDVAAEGFEGLFLIGFAGDGFHDGGNIP